jgi:SPP1 gp7 family putative phage head morphogenesis protein
MSLNDELRDLELRHHVGIQRLSTGVVKAIIELLDRSDIEVVEKLKARTATLEGSFTSERLKNLLRAIRDINHDAHVLVSQHLRGELRELARYESDYQLRLLADQLDIGVDYVSPTAELLDAIVTAEPFDGFVLRDHVKGMRDNKLKRIQQAIQLGMIQGETSDQIIQRIRGTKARNYRDGVLAISRASAERIVRTAVNHISNRAAELSFEQNDDVVKELQAVATLDTRTCSRCAAMDGKRFKINDPKRPRYPLHLNCRCRYVPVTRSWRDMGFDIDELPPVARASMNGQVSGTETFETWLKRQSAAVQDETLGRTRGALFRRGGLKISRFVDQKGNQLTLDELREREASAFRKAKVA